MNDILLVQIYVNDIIFGSTNDSLCKEFSQDMQNEFEMSMKGELNFFLRLCWLSNAVTFCSFMSQGNFNGGLPKSAPDRQVFKI